MPTNITKKQKMLLHTCCAVCASYPIEYLSDKFDVSILYYNPNIYPKSEYQKRLKDLKTLSNLKGVYLIIGDYENHVFEESVKGFENEPEGKKRCEICFKIRLEKTAEIAEKYKYDWFASTLTLSPHKDHKIINSIAKEAAERYKIQYYESNFKKNDGFKKANLISNQLGFYRQNYCGCRYSLKNI